MGLGNAGAHSGLQTSEIDTSAELKAILGDETGSGAAVFGTGPTLSGVLLSDAVLTAGTMTAGSNGMARSVISKFSWANAMVVALGAALTGDITVCTLPAKTVVKRVWINVTGTAAGVTTLTIAVGRTSALYIDYIVASDAKVAANTVYGDASGELGTNLTGYDLPSVTGTTAVVAHFISTVQNLNATTGSTGDIYLETMTLP